MARFQSGWINLRAQLTKLADSDFSRMLRGSAFIFGYRVSGAGIAFLTQILLARWMGASELGIYVLGFSWLVTLSAISVAGFNGASMRFVGHGLAHDDHGYIWGFVRRARQIVLAISLVISIFAAVILLAQSELTAQDRGVFLIALSAVPIFALISLHDGFANAVSRFWLSFFPMNVLRPFLFLCAIWVAWYVYGELNALLVMQLQWIIILLIGIMAIGLFERGLRRTIEPVAPVYETKLWTRTATSIMLMGLFNNYFPEFSIIIIGFFLPTNEIAVYNAGYRIALLCYFGLSAVDAFMAPEMVRLYTTGDKKGLKRVINRTTRLRFWMALLAIAVFVTTGKWLLSIFGEEFVAGYNVLVIIAAAQLVQAGVGPVARLLSITGYQDHGLFVSAGSLVFGAVLIALIVPHFGITGAAGAAFAAITIWCAGMRYLVVHYLDIRPSIFGMNTDGSSSGL
jgi:O-antigen/teichoic acid export membrane protein